MTTKIVTTKICNRCAYEYSPSEPAANITDLRWMIVRNGGGSMDSHMSLDLCTECTDAFLHFMKNH